MQVFFLFHLSRRSGCGGTDQRPIFSLLLHAGRKECFLFHTRRDGLGGPFTHTQQLKAIMYPAGAQKYRFSYVAGPPIKALLLGTQAVVKGKGKQPADKNRRQHEEVRAASSHRTRRRRREWRRPHSLQRRQAHAHGQPKAA